MTEARALLYENAIWLIDKLVAIGEAGAPVDPTEVQSAAEMAKGLVEELRDVEAKRRPLAWERALDRHHLSLVREA